MFAAAANFSDYLSEPFGWKYDFLKLTVGTGIIYGFAFGIPFLFWLYFKWVDMNISLIELLCIYGYSLFIYCPVAVSGFVIFVLLVLGGLYCSFFGCSMDRYFDRSPYFNVVPTR